MHGESRPGRFLITWAIAALVTAAAVATFDALVDPFLLFNAPRIVEFNARKPSVETDERMMKAYQVLRASPRTLLLGTSRVDMGLDSGSQLWPQALRPVYNLGIAGGNLYTSLRYLQHVLSREHIEFVVLGLDFEYFLTSGALDLGTGTEFEARLAVKPDGTPNRSRRLQELRDFAHGTLSLDALEASVATITDNLEAMSPDLSSSGDFSEAGMRRDTLAQGSYELFTQRDLRNLRFYRGKQVNHRAMSDLKRILDLCASHGTRVILFINPTHADELETFDLLGFWNAFEDWKRSLVAVVSAYHEPGGDQPIPLWDFSGYDPHSTESVAGGRRAVLEWFWEPSHYTKRLGSVILGRINGTANSDYGVLLTKKNIDARIASVRTEQLNYRESHAGDVRRMRDLYNSVIGIPEHATVQLK